jgi:hypothetical protein
MAQQTALQLLLLKAVDLEIGKYLPSDVLNELQKAYFELKELNRQQIESAWKRGDGEHDKVADKLAKQYYTETYTNE